ncbi:hypothetical protein RHGRI_011127 [Rhododendron griersonianum]|uniref:Uncharacterized protein n=1 Tax=Rhododendron griersonianum TaxID=479676 RepID=A0AAV6KKY0_9ERIC|nr:hypothetical protein RHGRI_011127 [Rhododendron griersonianum]
MAQIRLLRFQDFRPKNFVMVQGKISEPGEDLRPPLTNLVQGPMDLLGLDPDKGKALNAVSSRNVIPAKNSHALIRLDRTKLNACRCLLGQSFKHDYMGKPFNHLVCYLISQVPDFLNARINGLPVKEVINTEEEFTKKVQKVREVKCLSRSGEDPQVHQLLSQLSMPSNLLSLQLLRRLIFFWSKSFLLTFWLE